MRGFRFTNTIRTAAKRFLRDERGSATYWVLFWTVGLFALSGIAIDGAQAWRMRAILQAAADASAHAGVLALSERGRIEDVINAADPTELLVGDDPVDVALAMSQSNISPEVLGEVLTRRDVELGTWDPEEREFVAWTEDPNAVRVFLYRAHRNANPEPTFLVRLVGLDAWDIGVSSVAYAQPSPRAECPDPILAAQARIDVQTNDVFVGICVLADVLATVDTSEEWLPTAAVDFIDELMLTKLGALASPAILEQAGLSDLIHGTTDVLTGVTGSLGLGLGESGSGTTGPIPLVDKWLGSTRTELDFDSMIADMKAEADTVLTRDGLDFTDLLAGVSYYIECDAGEFLSIPAGTVLRDTTLISECPIRVDHDVDLQTTVVIANLNALRHIELTLGLPEAVYLTRPDSCEPGDGVQILIYVNAETTARFKLFDAEVFPLGDLLVAANSYGVAADSPITLGLNLDVVGDLTLGAIVEDLLGVCLGAQFMLNVDVYRYAN